MMPNWAAVSIMQTMQQHLGIMEKSTKQTNMLARGVRRCACGFLLNLLDIWHPWTPCPLSQRTHTHRNIHTLGSLNNEVSCLSHTLGPPFMPHPFMSSSTSISCAVILLCYSLSFPVAQWHNHAQRRTHCQDGGQVMVVRDETSIENNYSCGLAAPWPLQYKKILLVRLAHVWPTSCPVCLRW